MNLEAEAVHQMIKDELDLDGRPNLNLASFVGTYMEREAEALMIENISKNMSDADEYPAMMVCGRIGARRFILLIWVPRTSTLAAFRSLRTCGELKRENTLLVARLPVLLKPYTWVV